MWRSIIVIGLLILVWGGGAILLPHLPRPTPEPSDPTTVIKLPEEVKGEIGDFVVIKADTLAKNVLWNVLDVKNEKGEIGLTSVPSEFSHDPKLQLVIGKKVGTYRVQAIASVGGVTAHAMCRVVIGTPNPAPPPPLPPDPNPPSPPPPPPPAPVDPLVQKLQAAYNLDKAPAQVKMGQVLQLSGLYGAMVAHANDKTIGTTGLLLDDLRKTADAMIAKGVLVEVRKVISIEVATVLGIDPMMKLDDTTRAKAAEVFGRIDKALSAVK